MSRKIRIDQDQITASLLTAGNEGVLIVINHSPKRKSCWLKIEEKLDDFCDLETGDRVKAARDNRGVVLNLKFPGLGVRVLKFSKEDKNGRERIPCTKGR